MIWQIIHILEILIWLLLAATITPLANPNSVFCSRSGISFFMKKTNADPSMVPNKGSSIPIITAFITQTLSEG